ncbi:tyrosine-type recombinase/integrase [Ancylobacter radicis]|uniref:tyrosine-type recombinase/integrase n=1 Tax=Ancylobacter radicis TaxID=2836179 RepID=UPI00350F904B
MKAHLTERSVKGLQPKQKNIIVYDEEVVGFGVRITSGGTRAFILTYRIEARERRLTIGAWPDWSVAAAREEAKRLKREIDQGRDPMAERDEARESPNVRQLIDRYLEEHAAKLAKRNRDDQASMLRKLVEPAWGPRKAAEIQPDDVDRLLRRIGGGTPGKRGRKPTPVRANRVGEILRKMFNLAIRWRIRSDNPAAGFARNAEAPRDRYLSSNEIGRLSAALDTHPNRRAADAVRLILLTGARRGEVLCARWDQFDLEAAVWIKPAATTKQRRLHRAPISASAAALPPPRFCARSGCACPKIAHGCFPARPKASRFRTSSGSGKMSGRRPNCPPSVSMICATPSLRCSFRAA